MKTSIRPKHHHRPGALAPSGTVLPSVLTLLVCLLLACAPMHAQAVPESDDDLPPADDEVVELSRFTVSADGDDDSYRARDTLAGTRLRTELKDVGSAVSVVTDKFLLDTGSKKSEDLLVYTTNTEVRGLDGNFLGSGNESTRVRGLTSADNTRDFFLTSIPWDSYNVGRIDIQRGPNSILFGLGSPAGIINASVNAAAFKDSNVVEGIIGSYASMRASADFNKTLLKDELALRASLLYDHTKYQQKPAFNKDERYYAALRYDPKFLRFEGARTSLRANYEHGNISSNWPNLTPPIDTITPWFDKNGLNKRVFNPNTVGISDLELVRKLVAAGDLGAGALNTSLTGKGPDFAGVSNLPADGGTYNPWLTVAGNLYEQMITVFDNPNSSKPSGMFPGRADLRRGLNAQGEYDDNITGFLGGGNYLGILPFDTYATRTGLPYSNTGVYKAKSLADSSIYDYFNNVLEGPNKGEWQKFEASNIALSQNFFHERLGFEVVYDWQKYTSGWDSYLSSGITVDINTHLTNGEPNPNLGRPFVTYGGGYSGSNENKRENWRFTAYGELKFSDFMDKTSWLTRLLGRHVFTGLYSTSQTDSQSLSWRRTITDQAYGERIRYTDNFDISTRAAATINYLGPSLLNAATASGAHFGGLRAIQRPSSGMARFFDSTWNAPAGVDPAAPWFNTNFSPDSSSYNSTQSENPANYVGWTNIPVNIWNADAGDRARLLTHGNMTRDEITSEALVWQGYFWDGVIVPTVGWREDTIKNYGASAIQSAIKTMSLPTQARRDETGRSTSWSIVAHTPKWIAAKMPWNTSISVFYNNSSNFQPAGNRVDVYGSSLASPNGKTKDYGFVINTLNDRLTLKINWYQTQVYNASLSNIGLDWYLGEDVAWSYMFAMQAKHGYGPYKDHPYDPVAGQTQEQATAEMYAAADAIINNMPSQAFLKAWGLTPDVLAKWQDWVAPSYPPGLSVTGDTLSKGIEFELTAQPVKNWNITANVSKTNAQRVNMAANFVEYVESRHALLKGPAGNLRLWGPGSGNERSLDKFVTTFYGNYRLYRMLENSDVPELRPWHFNIITSYAFDHGWPKGFSIGAAYRWQSKIVTGYPINPATGEFNIANPYYGPVDEHVDFWIGYQRQFGKKVRWSIQLNLRNLFEEEHLVPVSVQYDGSPAVSRIAEGMVWSVTNRFEF